MKKYLFLFAFLLLVDLMKINASSVIDLDSHNIESEVMNHKYGFVLFTSQDCRHCQAVEPIFFETAVEYKNRISKGENLDQRDKDIKEKLPYLGFFKVNSNSNFDLMTKYKIDQVPTIIWFNNEKDHYKIYDDETEMPNYFFDFALEQVKYGYPEINLDDLIRMSSDGEFNGKNILLYVGESSDKNTYFFKNIMNTAWNMGYKNLFCSNDPKIKMMYNINLSPDKFDVIIFKVLEKKFYIEQFEKMQLTEFDFVELENLETARGIIKGDYNPNFDLAKAHSIKKISNLMKLFSFYPLNQFSHQNEKIISSGIPTLVLIHNYEINSPQFTEILNIYASVANKYRREIFFMMATKQTKLTQVFVESFRIFQDTIPLLCMTSVNNEKQKSIDKFRKTFNGETITEADIVEFIESWKSMRLPQYIASEPIPTSPFDENNIYKIVADNFNKILEEQGRFVLISVCSDRLEICRKFRDRLMRISNKLRNSNRIIVAEFNPYLNEVDEFSEIQHIPTILLLPDRGEKLKNSLKYQGRLSTSEIIKWIREKTEMTDLEEIKLPVEDVLLREEDMSELKPLDLEQKGLARKIYEKLADPNQKELWSFPNKAELKKEEEILERYFSEFLGNRTKDEL